MNGVYIQICLTQSSRSSLINHTAALWESVFVLMLSCSFSRGAFPSLGRVGRGREGLEIMAEVFEWCLKSFFLQRPQFLPLFLTHHHTELPHHGCFLNFVSILFLNFFLQDNICTWNKIQTLPKSMYICVCLYVYVYMCICVCVCVSSLLPYMVW